MTTHYIPEPVKQEPSEALRNAVPRGAPRYDVRVAGVSFVEGYPHNLLESYPDFPDAAVVLVPDPFNKYDPNAIGVWVRPDSGDESYRIGYIPRDVAEMMTEAMEMGAVFRVSQATVMVSPDAPEHPGVELVIKKTTVY